MSTGFPQSREVVQFSITESSWVTQDLLGTMLIWCKQVVFKELVKDMIFDDWLQQFINYRSQSYGMVVIDMLTVTFFMNSYIVNHNGGL